MKPVEERISLAHSSDGDELWALVRDSHPAIISAVTLNRNLNEEMAVYLAKRKATPQEILGLLANDIRFKDSYKLKVAICKNPKTPKKITFGLLKFLMIFDLGDISRDQTVPISIRQKIEYMFSEKIPSLPSGSKIALARRSNSNIILMLMERSDQKVISVCLESPLLTEGHLIKIINKTIAKPLLIRMISESPSWTLRYYVRYALIRNVHTPMVKVVKFLGTIRTPDLRELFIDSKVPAVTKPFIFRELKDRGEPIESEEEQIYEVSEDSEPIPGLSLNEDDLSQ